MPEAEKNKVVRYDIDGYEIITNALKDLLNQFPELYPDTSIAFSTLEEDSGISFYPTSGSMIISESRSVTGKVNQLCNYPFSVVYRTAASSANAKVNIKEFLDDLGKWLEKQPIAYDGETHQIDKYPALTGSRVIEDIMRQTPSYLESTGANNVQDWVIQISLRYRNIFYRTN